MTPDELKAWRESHGLSQTALAQALPVSKRTLEGWEQGRYKIPEFLQRALNDLERELKRRGKRK